MNFKDMTKTERKAFIRFLLGKFRVEQEENQVLFPELKSASSAKSQFFDNGHGGTSKKVNGLLSAFAALCDLEIPAEFKKSENRATMSVDRLDKDELPMTIGKSNSVIGVSISKELVRWATDYVKERDASVVSALHLALKQASKPQLRHDVNMLKCIWMGVTITIHQNNGMKFGAIKNLANDFLQAARNSPRECESEVNAARMAFVKSLSAEWKDSIEKKDIAAARRCLSTQAKFVGQSLSEAEIDSFFKDGKSPKQKFSPTPFTKKECAKMSHSR